MISRRSRRRKPSLVRELDRLWSDCIRARAGGKSEFSGQPGQVAHHLETKPNHRLRYELDNGVWLTNGEHFTVHYQRPRMLINIMEAKRGRDLWDRLDRLRQRYCKTDLKAVKLMLEAELRKYA